MIITKQIRDKILPDLPRDFNKQVRKITGCHPNTITNVLRHEQDNTNVAEALINLAAIHRKKKNSLRIKAFNQLTKDKAA